MLECNGKGINEIDGADLAQQVSLGVLRMFWILSLDNMEPDKTCQVARCQGELRPVFTSVIVSFISCRHTEGKTKCNNETQDCKQDSVDAFQMRLATRLDNQS